MLNVVLADINGAKRYEDESSDRSLQSLLLLKTNSSVVLCVSKQFNFVLLLHNMISNL